ncbi:M28 family metallopeptidase [Blastococcus saxobsidens]|uniref:Double-zinc aminopeptidase n=1 Tax=Blastococcus saxobsidens (strain DD2) TaxID=1146883 RepID=H6RSJ2_BLASD|nr:M28 family metallopeptidase [Blastococcus saxobsidens]CCG01743.1 double-zinc aminopeptidase [Blastococcus saxobsidens DD2]
MTPSTAPRRSRLVAASAAGMLALAGSVATSFPAGAAGPGCDSRNDNTVAKLLECVTLDGTMDHLKAFQAVADANGGTRASGTPGYDASADYVQARLEAAGYAVTRQAFEFPYYELVGTPTLVQTAPTARSFAYGSDFSDMSFSGAADVTGTAVAVDPATTTSGCEATDFAGLVDGDIALVRRGGCTFGTKAANAEASGASAVVIYNSGTPGNEGLINGTLGAPVGIPALFTTTAIGESLADATLSLSIDTVSGIRETENVFAELPGRTSGNVVMAGAHLDSVAVGPGINDNGSGSAALLEVAESIAKVKPANTVRFAWWGAEELGLIGSTYYVNSLSDAQIEDIALYLNFDMVASPNFARFIYDGDQSSFQPNFVVPEGSAQIEYVFEDFYESRDLFYEGTEFSGRSDYQAFALAGIPSGGLFTGAEGVMQPYQAEAYDGEAGVAYDPCYHQECDDIGNLDLDALDQNADAIAYSILTLAYTTRAVNGVTGQQVPGGTYAGDPEDREHRLAPGGGEGGGLEHDHDHDRGETA